METLKLQTIGGFGKEIELPASQLADFLESMQSGDKKATPEMLSFTNQKIVDQFCIKSVMQIGGEKFLKFSNFDIAAVLDVFDNL